LRFTVEAQISKTRFWSELREQFPLLTPMQSKAINKLYDVGPEDFANGISTEKHVSLCRVSRATA
jgi:methylthioribose-1-phosphate isomerase